MQRLRVFPVEGNFRETFSRDILASVVVFLVALPLCLGIAVASGLPPAAGLVTGIIGGIVVGSFSGCPLQVSGPAAGLAVIVAELVQEHGVPALAAIVTIGGIIQLTAGALKLGQWFRAVPPAVINGMLSGIGALILVSQFHVMLDDVPKGSGINNLLSIPSALWNCLFPSDGVSSHIAGAVGLFTIVLLIIWQSIPAKVCKAVPAALVAVVMASLAAAIFNLPVRHVAVPDSLLDVVKVPTVDKLAMVFEWKFILEGLALAFIASAETLLTATAVDRMHDGPRTKYNRELMSQGIGNIICGFLGALPMTGVIVRSGVNVHAGARTRLSTVLHGVWLLLFVLFFPHILRQIPVSSLAALLVYTGFKLLNPSVVKTLLAYGKSEVAIYLITVGAIVCTDLLTGVLTGVALSVAKLLYIFSHLEVHLKKHPESSRVELHLKGAATFLSLPKLASALESIPPDTEFHVDFEDLDYIDHACLDLLMNWETQHRAQGGALVIDWGSPPAMFRDRRRTARSSGKNAAGSEGGTEAGNSQTIEPAREETPSS